MVETTVTMTLTEFRKYDLYEKFIEKLNTNENVYVDFSSWERKIFSRDEMLERLQKELGQAIEMRDHTIKEVRDYEKRTGKKVFNY